MKIPDSALTSELPAFEYLLLSLICLKADRTRCWKGPIAELCVLTRGASTSTVKRALKALSGAGYLDISRAKSSNGYWGVNIYKVLEPEFTSDLPLDEPWVMGDLTSHDYVTTYYDSRYCYNSITTSTSSYNYLTVITVSSYNVLGNAEGNESSTSYYSSTEGGHGKEKGMVSKYDDGEDLAGVGLTSSRDEFSPSVKKNDPKTRGKRPQHEWTPSDVAAEFSFLVGRKYPWLPGALNVHKLTGALAAYRKKYSTTPLLELEILKIFMADPYNFKDVGTEAPNLYRKFMYSFGTKIQQARTNLGMPAGVDESPKVATPRMEQLKSSDGLREYDKSMSGRFALKRYEERLMAKVGDD